MDRPPLGDYPKDANPPGGPLKFYAAMDGSNVDSVRANFGTDDSVKYVDGITGKAAQTDTALKGFISYSKANDFGAATNFTISIWVNVKLAEKDSLNPQALMALASTSNFWGNVTMFVDHNTTLDTMTLKFHFMNGTNDNWDFQYDGANGLKGMYDGNWHQIAFTYDATSKIAILYKDGNQIDQKTNESIAFADVGQFVIGGFEQAVGIQGNYGDNPWMHTFAGRIDNVRLYGESLSATDVKSLYDNKQ